MPRMWKFAGTRPAPRHDALLVLNSFLEAFFLSPARYMRSILCSSLGCYSGGTTVDVTRYLRPSRCAARHDRPGQALSVPPAQRRYDVFLSSRFLIYSQAASKRSPNDRHSKPSSNSAFFILSIVMKHSVFSSRSEKRTTRKKHRMLKPKSTHPQQSRSSRGRIQYLSRFHSTETIPAPVMYLRLVLRILQTVSTILKLQVMQVIACIATIVGRMIDR